MSHTTKRTVAQIADPSIPSKGTPPSVPFAPATPGEPPTTPAFLPPMKPYASRTLPRHGHWIYEIKFDGYRLIAVKDNRRTTLYSRNHKNVSRDYPDIRSAVARLPAKQVVIDGEIVALLPSGLSSFQLLQNRRRSDDSAPPPLFCYAFDLLNLNGRDLTSLPLHERKRLLRQLLADQPDPLRFSAGLDSDPETLLAHAKQIGLEGLVAKEKTSRYRPGRRSRSWLKLKLQNQRAFVIGGHTPPQGGRSRFGALLLGLYKNNSLHYVGRVGSGLTDEQLESLYQLFRNYRIHSCPFSNLPQPRSRPFGSVLTATEMKRCTWLRPELVCQIRFSDWTADNSIRHPVFLGLRTDKPARNVTFTPAPDSS